MQSENYEEKYTIKKKITIKEKKKRKKKKKELNQFRH